MAEKHKPKPKSNSRNPQHFFRSQNAQLAATSALRRTNQAELSVKRGQREKAVYPKHRVVNFDCKGNYATDICCFGRMGQWLWTCKSVQHKNHTASQSLATSQQTQGLRWPVTKTVWKIHSAWCWGRPRESATMERVIGSRDEFNTVGIKGFCTPGQS